MKICKVEGCSSSHEIVKGLCQKHYTRMLRYGSTDLDPLIRRRGKTIIKLGTGREIMGVQTHILYGIWNQMKQRCSNPKNSRYKNYGGRGISVCEEWLDFLQFERDMLPTYQKGLTLDRRDNDKGYSKENCHWATYIEQQNNTTRNRFIIFNGKRQTLTQWSRELNISISCIKDRLEKGWSIEHIFEYLKNNK